MIKAILIDADGVVLLPRNKFFSDRLNEDFGVPTDKILPFFKNEYKNIVVGKADLKEEISKYLDIIDWQKSVDELLDYWFSYENKLNQEVLKEIKKLRQQGIKCYLVSDHSKYRADDLIKFLGQEFDRGFFSSDFGVTKSNPEFFRKILSELKLKAENVVLIDDEEENIESAKILNIKSILFNKTEDFKSF